MEVEENTGRLGKLKLRSRLSSFLASSRRVFVIAKKPTRQEFMTMAKITGIGIIIIAIIGYIIQLIFALTGIGFT